MSPRRSRLTAEIVDDNSIFVDSSAWIAFFSRRDQHHIDADRMLRGAIASKRLLLTTNLVFAEIHRLLLYRAGFEAAGAALDRIETSSHVRIEFANAAHHQAAKEWMKRLSGHPISYADAVSFAVMEACGCDEVVSFDHHFRLAGFNMNPKIPANWK